MSRIIRQASSAKPVYIGERHETSLVERKAEQTLSELFPFVSFVTLPDGTKVIPLAEVPRLKAFFESESVKTNKEGYDQGYEAGLSEGKEDGRKVLRTFEGAIKDAVAQREILLQESKQNILQLVTKIARKITNNAIALDPEITLKMIAGVIEQLADRSKLTIKVHPNLLPVLEQETERLLAESTSIKELTVQADARVKEGGCFIETPSGDIDARIESQFEVIEDTIRRAEEGS